MLSVIVPATDSPPTLEACAGALRASLPEGAELLIKTGGPPLGPAAARNAAAADASGDTLVFVDSDVVVERGALAAIERRFAEDPGLAALFGSYDDRPAERGLVSLFRNLLHHHTHSSAAGRANTFWAGLGAVRREAFAAAGGFDSARYPTASIEDIDLGLRLSALGYRIELDPRIRGTHLKRWTLRSMVATDFSRRAIPWVRLLAERGRDASGLNVSARQALAALAALASAIALAGRRPRLSVAAALAMVAVNMPLYVLLGRAGGARLVIAGIPLSALHHLVSLAAVPVGLLPSRMRGTSR